MIQLIPYYAFCNKILILTAVHKLILISGKDDTCPSVSGISHQACTLDISYNALGFGAVQIYPHHFKGSQGREVSSPRNSSFLNGTPKKQVFLFFWGVNVSLFSAKYCEFVESS